MIEENESIMLEMFAFVDKILDVKLRPTFVDGVSSSE